MTIQEVILSGCPFKRPCWDFYDSNWYLIKDKKIILLKNIHDEKRELEWDLFEFLSLLNTFDDFIINKKYKHVLDFNNKLKNILD